MDDFVIELSNADLYQGETWHCYVDLQELANCAGKRVKDRQYGGYTTDYPMNKVKRLLKFIRKYGTEEDFAKCDKYLAPNAKVIKCWKAIR